MKITYVLIDDMDGIVIVIPPSILGFYELSEEACKISVLLITLHNVLALLLHPTSSVPISNLGAAGDMKVTMYMRIGFMVIFRLGAAILFGIIFRMGVARVWAAIGTDWFARAIAFSIRYKNGKWRCVKVI